jgi:hypothetical protein
VGRQQPCSYWQHDSNAASTAGQQVGRHVRVLHHHIAPPFPSPRRVLSSLQHPCIVRFLGACLAPPHICILEELAQVSAPGGAPGLAARPSALALTDLTGFDRC